ncbi:zn-finger domain-containing protein [Gigaspora margarita]|uniref:Zn-finger domain-containing protein n=1 Tax=Gigaspora margarita TaxID=4874 RepID=A0A8H3XPB5_GIGMA|nr:zn-finger domain-containing protein [Gigaspora margarita]
MSDFKCNFCPCTFTKHNTLSKYMNVCVLTASEDEQLFANNLAQVRKFSNPSKLNQNENFDINEYKSDSEFSAKKISFKDIKFHKTSKVVKDIQFNSNSNLDSTFASPLHVSNTDELASGFDNMSFELDNSNINLNIAEVDLTSNLPDDIETTINKDQEFSNEILNNSTYFEHIRSSSSDEEFDQKYEEFPNEAYADLMVLVTKYKLSNAAENGIISFFNKHSKYSTSLLPKNIRQRKEFMNNIKSNLSYKKTKVLDLDDTEYFLYHMSLISCIENILKIPDIAQNLEFEYKELYKTTEDGKEIIYKEQNNGIWWKTAQNSLPIGSKLLSIILYSDATNCDTLGKSQLHPIYMSLGNIPTW